MPGSDSVTEIIDDDQGKIPTIRLVADASIANGTSGAASTFATIPYGENC